jgi:UDP-glucose 4-epimerase
VFNVATGTRFTLKETYAHLSKLTNFSKDPKFGPERAGDVKHSLADISSAKKHLGYNPQVGFEEGLSRTVAWYQNSR